MKYFYYKFPFCGLGIAEKDGVIHNVFFTDGKAPINIPNGLLNSGEETETPLLKKAAKELMEYFNGERKVFDIPFASHGTEFRLKVWEKLNLIPYGETRSYGEIAKMIGNPKASRAVGMANNRNPLAIIVPCHRVIGHDGNLTGYAGGLKLKQQLLDLEKQNKTKR